MVIAANIRALPGDAGWSELVQETLLRIAVRHPRTQVLLISNSPELPVTDIRNVQVHGLPQRAGHALALKWWYHYRLPRLLRTAQASVLLQSAGLASHRTTLPQCILLPGLSFIRHPQWLPRAQAALYAKQLPDALRKAAALRVPAASQHVLPGLKLPVAADRLQVWQPLPPPLERVGEEERETVKATYTAGCEYFVCRAAIHPRSHLLALLKAFSLFKKRMKSSMRLVILSDVLPEKDAWVESLRLYKYRTELHLLAGLQKEEAERLLRSAYAGIQLSVLPAELIRAQSCWPAAVPLLAADDPVARDLLGSGAFYAAPEDPAALAAQLMHLYRDEQERKALVEQGNQQYAALLSSDPDEQLYQLLRSLQNQ